MCPNTPQDRRERAATDLRITRGATSLRSQLFTCARGCGVLSDTRAHSQLRTRARGCGGGVLSHAHSLPVSVVHHCTMIFFFTSATSLIELCGLRCFACHLCRLSTSDLGMRLSHVFDHWQWKAAKWRGRFIHEQSSNCIRRYASIDPCLAQATRVVWANSVAPFLRFSILS